VPSREGNKK
jgi:hypothetical protein